MIKRRRIPAIAIAALALASAAHAQDEAARRAALDARLHRLESLKAIERLQNAFGYYQDRFLFDQPPTLFAKAGAEVHWDGGVWLGSKGMARLWGGWLPARLGADRPTAGRMFDQPQMQGLIDLAPDGRSAHARFRTLGRQAQYGKSEAWVGGAYENDYVLEDGVWKFRALRYCTTWQAPYETGVTGPPPPVPGARDKGGPDRIDPTECRR